MPASIIGGMLTFLIEGIEKDVWDGETPRTSVDGVEIVADATGTSFDWPVVRVRLTDQGLKREWTFEDSYSDVGPLIIDVYGVTRKQVEDVMDGIEALLANSSNWPNVHMEDSLENDQYFIYDLTMESWTCVEEEGVRLKFSNLSYRGQMNYNCELHGEVATR